MLVSVAVEGVTDLPIARRLLSAVGLEPGQSVTRQGKGALDARMASYNHAAGRWPWLVLRDLDHDAPCAPALVVKVLPTPARGMCLRIAVRAAEAWLIADREAIAGALGVAVARVTTSPDQLDDPKRALVRLATASRRRSIRESLVPEEGKTAIVGPGYLSFVTEFCSTLWDPVRASASSPSLASAVEALRRLGRLSVGPDGVLR